MYATPPLSASVDPAPSALDARPTPADPARQLVGALARGWVLIAIVTTLVTGAVAFAALRTPRTYEAESSLLVRIGREYVYRPETGRAEAGRTPSLSEMVNSEVEILSSRDLAEQVVREIGVDVLYPELLELDPDPEHAIERAVLRFRNAASIRPVLESSVIKVGYEHIVPQVSAYAVNLLVDRFADKHVEVFGEERADRIAAQLDARSAELALAEDALAAFKLEHGVFDLAEQRRLLIGRRVALDEGLQAAELELAELEVTLADAPPGDGEATVELPPHLSIEMKGELVRQRYELVRALRGLEAPGTDALAQEASLRLLDLSLEESRLLEGYGEDSRQVRGVRSGMERVHGFLEDAERRAGVQNAELRVAREERARLLQGDIDRLGGEIELLLDAEQAERRRAALARRAALELQREALLGRIEAVDTEMRTLDRNEKSLRQLERALETAEAGVETYAQRVDEARIGEELDRERRINVRIIERAAPPVEPVGLPPTMKIALGAFVGLLAGAGVAVLADLFRSR